MERVIPHYHYYPKVAVKYLNLKEKIMPEEDKIKSAADAVKGIVQAIPIYQDALQPAAREIGKAFQTITKTIHIALAPISALVWGYEKIGDFVTERLSELMKDIPPERIITPPPNVAGPTIEALRYVGQEPSLREMYAKLLATSMDKESTIKAHPAFVEIIKQLNPDEARLISYLAESRYRPQPIIDIVAQFRPPEFPLGYLTFKKNISLLGKESKCNNPELSSVYLVNLNRLGLIELRGAELAQKEIYEQLEKSYDVQKHLKKSMTGKMEIVLDRHAVHITDFGQQFIDACVKVNTVD